VAQAVVVAVAAVALRREAGPVGYALVGLVAYYCLSVMVTAVAVGVAGLVADSLESRPVSSSTGWRVIGRRRRSIAGWALVDLVAGVPSRTIGSWTVDQLGVLLIGFGWGLVSFFAIPTIALTGASPLATARQSLRLVRRRWGDAVYSTVYLWVRAAVVFGLPATVAAIAGVLLIRGDRVIIGGALFVAGVAGLALAYLLTQTARAVLDRRALSIRRVGDGLWRLSVRTARARSARPLEPRPPPGPADRGRSHPAGAPASARRPRRAALRHEPGNLVAQEVMTMRELAAACRDERASQTAQHACSGRAPSAPPDHAQPSASPRGPFAGLFDEQLAVRLGVVLGSPTSTFMVPRRATLYARLRLQPCI
jgi:hypothetical protein